jgi:L-iditol 2-dehydrogenase
MWSYRVVAPGFVERADIERDSSELQEGHMRLRLVVGGMCGSDMPRFNGAWGKSARGDFGYAPVHEVVGEVIESASSHFKPSQHVVGTLGPKAGLAEIVTAHESAFVAVPEGLDDVEALTIQSLGTVLRAARRLPDVHGRSVAVIGTGPCGLAFCHVLKNKGARWLSAIDPVERSEVAQAYGADEFFATTSHSWLGHLDERNRPDVVVDVVGHQQGTIADAISAVADHGFVYGFGAPDDADYVIPYQLLYNKDAILASGRTLDNKWQGVLQEGSAYLMSHRKAFANYISHVLPVKDVQKAYELYARPQAGRLKVAIVNSD